MNKDLLDRIIRRHPRDQGWVVEPEVAFTQAGKRRVDALAMQVFQSRGFQRVGFEIKVHRSDWLRELRAPSKAEDIWDYVNQWWLVVPTPDLVHDGELPEGWGLLVPHGAGLRAAVKAKITEAKSLDAWFLASMVRRIWDREEARAGDKARQIIAEKAAADGASIEGLVRELENVREAHIDERRADRTKLQQVESLGLGFDSLGVLNTKSGMELHEFRQLLALLRESDEQPKDPARSAIEMAIATLQRRDAWAEQRRADGLAVLKRTLELLGSPAPPEGGPA